MCTVESNVQGRTGSGTPVRLHARTTGAVDPRFRSVYSLHYESHDLIGCVRWTHTSRLVCPLWLLWIPHACTVAVHTCTVRVRYVQAGLRILLCYPMLYPPMRLHCLIPFQPAYIVILLPIVYSYLVFVPGRESHIAGAVV